MASEPPPPAGDEGPALRPCARCGRHHRDEPRCPHCGSDAWRAPPIPPTLIDLDERVSAPKYGGPPLRRFGVFTLVVAFFAALGALARWLAR